MHEVRLYISPHWGKSEGKKSPNLLSKVNSLLLLESFILHPGYSTDLGVGEPNPGTTPPGSGCAGRRRCEDGDPFACGGSIRLGGRPPKTTSNKSNRPIEERVGLDPRVGINRKL